MEDKQYVDTYNFDSVIKDIEVSPVFIVGLEQIIFYYIANIIEDPSSLANTFNKYDKIMKGESENISLSETETHLYTLYALQQLLKFKANEQGLNKKIEANVNKDHLKTYLTSILKEDKETVDAKIDELFKVINKSPEIQS